MKNLLVKGLGCPHFEDFRKALGQSSLCLPELSSIDYNMRHC